MEPTSKSPLKSKTVWTNVVIALAAFLPVVQSFLSAHPLVLAEVMAVANLALRAVTKDKLSLEE